MRKFGCIIYIALILPSMALAQEALPQCDACRAEMEQKIEDVIKDNTPEGTTVTITAAPVDEGAELPGAPAPATKPAHQPLKFELKNREFNDKEKISLLLNAHCDFPSKEDLLSTSPDAEKHIRDIIQDETILQSVRQRALEALAYFDTPENEESLRKVLEDAYDSTDDFSIVYSLRAYSRVAGEKSVPLIERFLSHPRDYVRLAAISNLKLTPGKAALEALKQRRQIETNRFFIAQLDQAINNHCKQKKRCSNQR